MYQQQQWGRSTSSSNGRCCRGAAPKHLAAAAAAPSHHTRPRRARHTPPPAVSIVCRASPTPPPPPSSPRPPSSSSPRPRVPLSTQDQLKAQLLQLVTRLNSPSEADDPALQRQLLGVIDALTPLSPTPRPAESPALNATWALLYTLPGEPPGDVRRGPLQRLLAALYSWFYEYAPVLAGSAVGKRAARGSGSNGSSGSSSGSGGGGGSGGVKSRGQFQIFDTAGGRVSNQAKFSFLGVPGVIQVDGPASIDAAPASAGRRVNATFTAAELRWGPFPALRGAGAGAGGSSKDSPVLRLQFPIDAFRPSGFIDTLYLDPALRVSRGDKGSYFIASSAANADVAPFLPLPPAPPPQG